MLRGRAAKPIHNHTKKQLSCTPYCTPIPLDHSAAFHADGRFRCVIVFTQCEPPCPTGSSPQSRPILMIVALTSSSPLPKDTIYSSSPMRILPSAERPWDQYPARSMLVSARARLLTSSQKPKTGFTRRSRTA